GADSATAKELEKVFRRLDTGAYSTSAPVMAGAAAIQAAPDAQALRDSLYSLGAGVYSNGLNVAALEAGTIATLFARELANAPRDGIHGFAQYRRADGAWSPASLRGSDKTASQWFGGAKRIGPGLVLGSAFINADTRWNETLGGSDIGASSKIRQ